ncbi:MAG: hypothetical protein ACOVRK_03535, partial [Chryseobacterium taeanense]
MEENGLSAGSKLFDLTNYVASQKIFIAATSTCNETDLKINMGGTAIRKGYSNNQFKIVVNNQSRNISNSSILKLTIPSSVSITGSSMPIAQQENITVNAKNYTRYSWNMGTLSAF